MGQTVLTVCNYVDVIDTHMIHTESVHTAYNTILKDFKKKEVSPAYFFKGK